MHDNFKMLERLSKQKSEYSVEKLGVLDMG